MPPEVCLMLSWAYFPWPASYLGNGYMGHVAEASPRYPGVLPRPPGVSYTPYPGIPGHPRGSLYPFLGYFLGISRVSPGAN